MSEIDIKAGDFVVFVKGAFHSVRMAQVDRVTAQTVYYTETGRWSSGKSQCDKRGVKFSGSEEIAKRLYDQLVSSNAQYDEEQRKAALRKQERDQKFIAESVAS